MAFLSRSATTHLIVLLVTIIGVSANDYECISSDCERSETCCHAKNNSFFTSCLPEKNAVCCAAKVPTACEAGYDCVLDRTDDNGREYWMCEKDGLSTTWIILMSVFIPFICLLTFFYCIKRHRANKRAWRDRQ